MEGGARNSPRRPGCRPTRLLATTASARIQYEILETIETAGAGGNGGWKSNRAGKANLRDGFCLIPQRRAGKLQTFTSPSNSHARYYNTSRCATTASAGPTAARSDKLR